MTIKGALTASIIAGATVLSSCGKKEETEAETKKNTVGAEKEGPALIITAIPDEKISDQTAKYEALAAYLSKKLDIKVDYDISNNYDAAVNRFANDEVHLVWFGGLTGVQARAKVPGARAIAQGQVDPEYKSYFIAHESTGLTKSDKFPTEFSKFTFTFGSKKSTSGRLMPTWFIQQETGKTPEEFFEQTPQFRLKGSHAATAKVVNEGSVQTGVLSYKTYDGMVKDGSIDPNKARIIWETPGYADYNFTAHPSLEKTFGEGFVDKLQKALIECDDAKALGSIRREKLISAKNEDFDGIVKIAKELEFIK